MELIINPTNRCNFDCTFCSAYNLPKGDIDRKRLYNYIKCKRDEINIIIFNGGDPLMMEPEFYTNIIELTKDYWSKGGVTNRIETFIGEYDDCISPNNPTGAVRFEYFYWTEN